MNASNDDQPTVDEWLPVRADIEELADRAVASGKMSRFGARVSMFPFRVDLALRCIAEHPGVVWALGQDVHQACEEEAKEILRYMKVVLGSTQAGKVLFKKWKRLLDETAGLLTQGLLRAILGGVPILRLRQLAAVKTDAQFDAWLETSTKWPSARREAWFRKWYDVRSGELFRKWKDMHRQTDEVWGECAEVLRDITVQFRVVRPTIPAAMFLGRIPAKWRKIQRQAEDYLKDRPERDWPESQNKFAELIGTSPTTLKKAIENSPDESILRTWNRKKDEWRQNKQRTRGSDAEKPAVVSLQSAQEPIADPSDDTCEMEARELLDRYTHGELVHMLRGHIEKAMRRANATPKGEKEMLRELNLESKDREEIARLIVAIKQQYQDTFDDDPEAKFKQRRKP